MLTQIAVEKMPFYQLGMERCVKKGMERGVTQGIERGMKLGCAKGEVSFLLRLLGYKFGTLPPHIYQRIEHASSDELAAWGQRILNATTLSEVFDDATDHATLAPVSPTIPTSEFDNRSTSPQPRA